MFAPPPMMNKLTINSMNCEKLIDFYCELGILFNTEIKAENEKSYTYINDDFIFEIKEVDNINEVTKNVKIRFLIDEIDGYIEGLKEMGIRIIKESWRTESYQHIQLNDPDGNLIELMTKK